MSSIYTLSCLEESQARSACRPISLLAFLQAENRRLQNMAAQLERDINGFAGACRIELHGQPLPKKGQNMKFQVGRLTCEMSIDGHGQVTTRWFLRNGRKADPPHYLDAADRRQYRARREAFLRAARELTHSAFQAEHHY
jgi:hypothetical protein